MTGHLGADLLVAWEGRDRPATRCTGPTAWSESHFYREVFGHGDGAGFEEDALVAVTADILEHLARRDGLDSPWYDLPGEDVDLARRAAIDETVLGVDASWSLGEFGPRPATMGRRMVRRPVCDRAASKGHSMGRILAQDSVPGTRIPVPAALRVGYERPWCAAQGSAHQRPLTFASVSVQLISDGACAVLGVVGQVDEAVDVF